MRTFMDAENIPYERLDDDRLLDRTVDLLTGQVIVVNVVGRLVSYSATAQSIDGLRLAMHLSQCSPAWPSSTRRARIKAHVFGSLGLGPRACVP